MDLDGNRSLLDKVQKVPLPIMYPKQKPILLLSWMDYIDIKELQLTCLHACMPTHQLAKSKYKKRLTREL